jgi:hypothetical protein
MRAAFADLLDLETIGGDIQVTAIPRGARWCVGICWIQCVEVLRLDSERRVCEMKAAESCLHGAAGLITVDPCRIDVVSSVPVPLVHPPSKSSEPTVP